MLTCIISLFWSSAVYAGPAVIFSGSDVKTLKPSIDLYGNSKLLSGATDPTSVAVSAPKGSLYLNNSNANIYRKNDNGLSTNWTNLGSGSGTVTSVGLSLPGEFTVSNSPVTTTGTLTAVWASQTANKVFASPNGSSGTPAFRALVIGDLPSAQPTFREFTTGSGTYTTPAGVTRLHIRLCGGGGGGGGGASNGTAGSATSFGTTTGNGGGFGSSNPSAGGSGGSAAAGTASGLAISGGDGGAYGNAAGRPSGGIGGSSFLGGAGSGGPADTGNANSAKTNSCSGGGGGGGSTISASGSGGGAGGFVDGWIIAPAASYAWAVGAGGAGGSASANTGAGGNGADGVIFIEEYYGSF